MTIITLNIFLCAYWLFVYLLFWKCLIYYFDHLNWVFCLVWICRRSLYILWVSFVRDMLDEYFCLASDLPFHFPNGIFKWSLLKDRTLMLMKLTIINFSFMVSTSCVPRNFCLYWGHKIFFSVFVCKFYNVITYV